MHTASPLPLFQSLLMYSLICLLSVSFGMALLSWLRPSLPWTVQLGISPVISLSIWSISITSLQTLGISLQSATPAIWLITFICCGYGTACWCRRIESLTAIVAPAAAPLILLFPAFWNGINNYQISTPDGWNYIVMGQYLWGHSKLAAAGPLSPLYQYARDLSHLRIVGASLLGFFSFLFGPGDSQLTFNLLLAFAVFALAASTVALASGLQLSWQWCTLLVALVALSGWTADIIFAGNLDQLISLPYLLAGVAICLNLNTLSLKEAVIIGLIASAAVTTYIELAPMALFEVAVVLVYGAITRGARIREQLLFYSAIVLSGIAFASLNWRSLQDFLVRQLHAAFQSQASRPGEYVIHELIVPSKAFVTFWGFGAEWLGNPVTRAETVAAILLGALLLYGIYAVFRARHAEFIFLLAVCGGGMAYFAFNLKYGYGAYKIMAYTWWLICVCLTLGLKRLTSLLSTLGRWVILPFGLLPCVWLLAPVRTVALQPTIPSSPVASMSMDSFRALETLPTVTGGSPICLFVDDWLANVWAIYYTRDMPIQLGLYRMYLSSHPQLIDESRQAELANIRLLLADDTFSDPARWTLVKALPPYRLMRANSEHWALITDVKSDNGFGHLNKESIIGATNGIAEIGVLTNMAGDVELTGTMRVGDSVAGKPTRNLRVRVNGSDQMSMALTEGAFSLSIPVHKGRTDVQLTATDNAILDGFSLGDHRPLPFRIEGLTIGPGSISEIHALPITVRNPYHMDSTDLGSFYWMGTDPTKVQFNCERQGRAELRARFWPGPSVVGTSKRTILVTTGTYKQELVIADSGDYSIVFPTSAGLNTVSLLELDKPNVARLSNGDPRTLMLGVAKIEVDEADAPARSEPRK